MAVQESPGAKSMRRRLKMVETVTDDEMDDVSTLAGMACIGLEPASHTCHMTAVSVQTECIGTPYVNTQFCC